MMKEMQTQQTEPPSPPAVYLFQLLNTYITCCYFWEHGPQDTVINK